MQKLAVLVVIAACAVSTGCTTAGPFVTSISSDGRGNLIVEKNTVHHNAFTGTISSGDNPTTTSIKLIPESVLKNDTAH